MYNEEILKWLKETHGNISNIGFKYVVRVIELTIDHPDLPLTDIYEMVSKEYGTKTNNAEKVIRTYRKKTIYADIKNKEFISLLVYDYQESKSKEA